MIYARLYLLTGAPGEDRTPATGFGGQCSNPLSYGRLFYGTKLSSRDYTLLYATLYSLTGAPEGNRTPDKQLRRLLLYPTELQAQIKIIFKAIFMVGVTGLEPAASCSQGRRATNCATPRLLYYKFSYKSPGSPRAA